MAEIREEEGLRPAGAAQTSPPALATPRLLSRRRKPRQGKLRHGEARSLSRAGPGHMSSKTRRPLRGCDSCPVGPGGVLSRCPPPPASIWDATAQEEVEEQEEEEGQAIPRA